mgnify:CR=1 FL=1
MTFSAITGLQVEGTRIDGSVLVVELRPSTSGARFNLSDVRKPVMTRLASATVAALGSAVDAAADAVGAAVEVVTGAIYHGADAIHRGSVRAAEGVEKAVVMGSHAAATCIQAGYRGMSARNLVMGQQQAATKVQKYARGLSARKLR